MTNEEFIKARNKYAIAKYDIVEDFELKLFDCISDLVPLPNNASFEYFDYFAYDNEYEAMSETLTDMTCYHIIIPGHVVEMWFEGKTDEAKEILAKIQKTTERYRLKKD